MELEKYNVLKMDFKNLMSCIHHHEDSQNDDVILETLKTIIDICSNERCGKDAFREAGGLDFLVEFLFLTDNTKFLEHILKTLAFVIDENVHSQMYLSKKSVFEVLQAVWKKQRFPAAVQKNALVLISIILYHNSCAQNLVFETGILQDLLNMYEQHAQGLMINSSCMSPNFDNSVNFWMSTNSILCFAVNNPQNEKNQDICKNIFPVSLRILEFSSNSAVMNAVASFLTLTITDNEKNAATCGDLGILSIMIKLLLMETFDCQLKTKTVLSLGHCIAAFCTNKSYVLETTNFDSFLKKSLQLEDAELSSACKYLVQVCLATKGSLESDVDCTRDSKFDSVSLLKYDPEYSSDILKENFIIKEMEFQHPSLKQNSTKVPSIRSPNLKMKSKSRSLEKTYSSSSSSHKNTARTARRRRRNSKITRRSENKLSSIKKERLFNSSAVQCDILSGHHFSPNDKKYLAYINLNSNLDSSKCKSYKIKMNQSSSNSDKFSKPNIISNKMPFTDFLTKDIKSSCPKFKKQSFRKTDYSKTTSDSLISEWHTYNKSRRNENVKLSTNNSTKVESISQGNISNSFSPYEMKLTYQDSMQEKCPKLFKKKKKRISSDISSSSSSEYSFTPCNAKNCKSQENEKASQFGYGMPDHSEITFPKISKNSKNANDNFSNNCMEWNSNDKLQASIRKPLFFFNAENQVKGNHETEFSLKLSPAKFENDRTKDNSFSSCKMMPKIDKENSFDLTKFTGASFQHGKRLMDSCFSSNHVSHISRKSNQIRKLPQTSRVIENPYKKKCSWSCSSTGTCNESFSPISSPLNSSRHVQVVVLPKETCEQHGLSASVKLLEVVSLEDI
ncbi:unnamed protein product [Larinioides sclopetarius]|uniref:Telomere repeats-binding bouquet formation protein 1 n=1 Tax=Larinioides sclopetarius TaxID=280406 RepID=A0AAV1Z7U3_9ARAC